MAIDLFVGTVGTSVWFSKDEGETWARPYTESGLYLEARVWSLASSSTAPERIFAGTDSGLQRWNPTDACWEHFSSDLDAHAVWSLEVSPHDPRRMLAGTHPAAIFSSDDGGRTWIDTQVPFAEKCIFVGKPRVTQILFDTSETDLVWASVEIDGVWKSCDGGRNWTKCASAGLVSEDVHGLGLQYHEGHRTLFATTNKGFHSSNDDGDTWQLHVLDSPWQYTRVVVPRADHDGTLFLTNGDGPPGSTGRLLRSRDRARSWEDASLPSDLNSTPWCVATHPSDPQLIFVCTNLGLLFRSRDGGESWTRLKREFGEIRALMWQPSSTTDFNNAFSKNLGVHEQKTLAGGMREH